MLDAATVTPDITGAALAGLRATPKTLPPFLFYDETGVALFEAITRLPEYYLTRTELALLDDFAPDLAALAAPGSVLVEYGASSEGKALRLIDADPGRFTAYVPVDVAEGALEAMRARLALSHPALRVRPICGDFQRPITLPEALSGHPRFGFFPGSTIGNLDPEAAVAFLRQASVTLGEAAWLVVGADLLKDEATLVPAYDDAQGVTAAFNLNVLHRLNREAAADFDVSAFRHEAVWNAAHGRIEMHLRSLRAQSVRVAGMVVHFAAGETIHTENSYKHSLAGFAALAAAAGWTRAQVWTDPRARFAVHALTNVLF